jgi:hypothetical protein
MSPYSCLHDTYCRHLSIGHGAILHSSHKLTLERSEAAVTGFPVEQLPCSRLLICIDDIYRSKYVYDTTEALDVQQISAQSLPSELGEKDENSLDGR